MGEQPTDAEETAEFVPGGVSKPERRVVFPWGWLGLIGVTRLAFQFAPLTVDFKNLATLGSAILAVAGVCVWYVLRGRSPLPLRLAIGGAPFLLVYGCNQLYEVRFNGAGGITGMHRRGAAKSDEKLAKLKADAPAEGLTDWGSGEFDYPRFLGTRSWAEAIGPEIDTNWDAQRPEELWRREIGAGWSSFAVYGSYAVTQEQRGGEELVTCYHLLTGEPAWSHADEARFDPGDFAGQMGRQGPRATPTIVGDRVYTQGAMGLVNAIDARSGRLLWQVDTVETYGVTVPVWGKSGSPLFVPSIEEGDPNLLVVNVGSPAGANEGEHDASLVAFDAETGEEVWSAGWRQTSYASPALVELHGEPVVLQTVDNHLEARRARSGELLFEHPWSGTSDNSPSCSQPISLGDSRLLLTKGYGHGASLLQVGRDGSEWSVEPLWDPSVKPVLQTKYSNTVVHDGYAYALNGEMLQCVNVDSGEIAWRKRRRPKFGFGQVLLAGGCLMVLCEESGELVLVEPTPEGYQELASLAVLTEGETCWNNPVVAGDLLLVRNAVEAAAYRMPLAEPVGDSVAAR